MPSFLAFFLLFIPPPPEALIPLQKRDVLPKEKVTESHKGSSMGERLSSERVTAHFCQVMGITGIVESLTNSCKHMRQGERRAKEVCDLGRSNRPDLDSAKVMD